ncbi:piggyBac transposable element-derived protein 3-like [Nilaparvata lugens]|uniref:piggyBac transposable element-derived protein 3-like n=1 Tax=Nilaparvata lugens TaxID=108931 RepID=UPI00193DDC2A|nr:piggyBac transposable element-derived protein 3-like [Nilaparvata lugens]
MASQERLTLDEIASALMEDDDCIDGYITILPTGDLSDEDSGDEDDDNLDHLPGNILLSEAEATVKRFVDGEVVKEVITTSIENNVNDQITNINHPNSHNNDDATCSVSRKRKQRKTHEASNTQSKGTVKRKRIRDWVTKDVNLVPEREFELPEWLQNFETTDPVKYFELLYDDEVLDLICDFSNLYAFQNGEPNFKVEKNEMRVFLAILLISGYCQVPRLRMYWDERPDTNNKAIADAMSRNRFIQIMKYFHACDNNNLSKHRFAKVLPLWNKLNENWLKYFPNEVNLSIDESMIPYYGRHGGKQHMHNKPIRFGYKAWCLCTRLGYVVQSQLYQGCKTGINDINLGLGGSVVLDLIDKLPEKEGCSLYFDNFFTSITLLETLKEMGLHGTGTMRANRVEKAPLTDVKAMTKKERGTCESITDSNSGVTLKTLD